MDMKSVGRRVLCSALVSSYVWEGMNTEQETVTSVTTTAPANIYPYTDFKPPLNVCDSASSTTFSLLKIIVNPSHFVKL